MGSHRAAGICSQLMANVMASCRLTRLPKPTKLMLARNSERAAPEDDGCSSSLCWMLYEGRWTSCFIQS